MATALDTVDNLNVLNLVRGQNQAAVLTVEHAVKIDDAAVLAENTEVTYTDDELGFVFRGRITDVQEMWSGGEGVQYTCADAFRTIVKEPAVLEGSTQLKLEERTSGKTYLAALLDEFQASGHSPLASYDISAMEDVDVEPSDMAGQSLSEWINRMLELTTDTVCWIEYDVSDQPVLMFKKYSDQPDLELEKGNYTVVNPDEDDNPLIVDARIGKSLDNKYSRLWLEGCGHFKRWEGRYIPPTSWAKPNPLIPFYIYRFDVREAWATGRYLDSDGKCRDDMWVRIGMGYTSNVPVIGKLTSDIHNLETKTDEVTGQVYWEIRVIAGGIVSVDPPPVPQIQAWFTYTAYMEPLVEERTGSLSGEGALTSQHPDLYWFEGSHGVDLTSVLSGMADRLEDRYLDEADRRGNINVHIKGLDPDVQLGAQITAPVELDDPRLRGIRYNFIRRSMTFDCADTPLRPEIAEAQMKARLLTELRGNWYTSQEKEEKSCFCGGAVFVNEESTPRPNPGSGGGGDPPQPGPSWDCLQGDCLERDDANGQYATLADCERDCEVGGYEFVPCTGCVQQEFWGEYETLADCEGDNPDPFDPSFSCGSGTSQGEPSAGEEPSGKTFDCVGCSCEGAGGGEYFIGFIKSIEVDKKGRIVKAECADCTLAIQSGWTGSIALMCGASIGELSGVQFLVPYVTDLIFSNGILMEATEDSSGECFGEVHSGVTDKPVLLAGSECL